MFCIYCREVYVGDKCPRLKEDGSHVICEICTAPLGSAGCKKHPPKVPPVYEAPDRHESPTPVILKKPRFGRKY